MRAYILACDKYRSTNCRCYIMTHLVLGVEILVLVAVETHARHHRRVIILLMSNTQEHIVRHVALTLQQS